MNQKLWKVYVHTTPNDKKYVGITKDDPESRWRAGKGYYHQLFWNAILKYGWENIKHQVLFDNLTKEEACWIEQKLILAYHSNDSRYGYNITSGGEHHDVSSTTRAKISKANSGTNNGMYGKHHTDVSRKKISEANYRRNYSKTKFRIDLLQQGKQNYLDRNGGHSWNYGKHVSEEEKKVMSERQKKWLADHSHPCSGLKYEGERLQQVLDSQRMAIEAVKRPVVQYSKSGELIARFGSITAAETLTGIQGISKVCRTYERGYGRNKTAGGFIWKYQYRYGVEIKEV